MRTLHARDRRLSLADPLVMGILNVTPDSFSDGGRFLEPARALEHARALVAEGAAIIDVGGESTRPGAGPVPAEVQIARIVPVVERIAAELDVLVSVDTGDPGVIDAALGAGAGLVNDVRGFRRPGALAAAAAGGAAVCIMHMQGEPADMQREPRYDDVVAEVRDYLAARVEAALALGMDRRSILVDPGFGFGKTREHHRALFNGLADLRGIGAGLLVGVSRKSFVGAWSGRGPGERDAASAALAALAAERGADVVRAHAVAATVDAVRVVGALRRAREA